MDLHSFFWEGVGVLSICPEISSEMRCWSGKRRKKKQYFTQQAEEARNNRNRSQWEIRIFSRNICDYIKFYKYIDAA